MLKFSPIKRLSIGLVSMTITVVLTAQLLGILPKETAYLTERRVNYQNAGFLPKTWQHS